MYMVYPKNEYTEKGYEYLKWSWIVPENEKINRANKKGLYFMISDKTKKHIVEYNKAIDELLCQIATLKISENAQTLNVKALQHQKTLFSILTSKSHRDKIEKLFADIYDSHTEYLEDIVRKMSG